jgi:hypothetical protein
MLLFPSKASFRKSRSSGPTPHVSPNAVKEGEQKRNRRTEILEMKEPAPHVPIVPMSVRAPLVASMRYIETLLEPVFVT